MAGTSVLTLSPGTFYSLSGANMLSPKRLQISAPFALYILEEPSRILPARTNLAFLYIPEEEHDLHKVIIPDTGLTMHRNAITAGQLGAYDMVVRNKGEQTHAFLLQAQGLIRSSTDNPEQRRAIEKALEKTLRGH